jgi:lambda repressor-like predicted transcriptional regulator
VTDPLATAAAEARAIAEHTTARDAAIVAAREAGHSLRAIAKETGLTHPGISKILKRRAR